MKTSQSPEVATDAASHKTKPFFMALGLAALMVSAVGGGAALVIYHEFSTMPTALQASVRGSDAPEWAATEPMARPATASLGDRSDFRQVDNTVLSPVAARRVIAAWKSNPVYVASVPPPLEKTVAEESKEAGNRPPLTDPESHYIVNAAGQTIGVDGSAGAASEARQPVAPVAVAIQMPPPEIRMASPVQVRAALPVSPDDADANAPQGYAANEGVQYVPVRRAQPVTPGRSFNAANYLATEENVPLYRGQLVNPTSRATGNRHDFSLPDRSN